MLEQKYLYKGLMNKGNFAHEPKDGNLYYISINHQWLNMQLVAFNECI